MSEQPAKVSDQAEITDISSLLLSLSNGQYLLPGVSVAEVVSMSPIMQEHEDAPEWYLGNIQWRDLDVPLVVAESIQGAKVPALSDKCRIAVLNHSGLNSQLEFFAIIIQGIPRLLRVEPADIVNDDEPEVEMGQLMHAKLGKESVVIPDLKYVEQSIIDFLELS